MGHYASEMNPPKRFDPGVLAGRRADARSSASYRWELYQNYEQEGVWIKSDEFLTCPSCFSQVPALLRIDHDNICPAKSGESR